MEGGEGNMYQGREMVEEKNAQNKKVRGWARKNEREKGRGER